MQNLVIDRFTRRVGTTVWCLAMAMLLGCSGTHRGEDPVGDEPTVAAHDALNAVAWMRTAREYSWASRQTFKAATAQISIALADPNWDALAASERIHPAPAQATAVIVDVDETILDNSAFQASLVRAQSGFDNAKWSAWVNSARATAIPGALDFLQAASAQGVRVFYVTNRGEELLDATQANLHRLGFPDVYSNTLLMRGMLLGNCIEGSAKHCRRQRIGHGHRVLMIVGDQLADFVTTADGDNLDRYDEWIGERWFILPNPAYGRWESELFNSDWSLSESARRQRKIDAISE